MDAAQMHTLCRRTCTFGVGAQHVSNKALSQPRRIELVERDSYDLIAQEVTSWQRKGLATYSVERAALPSGRGLADIRRLIFDDRRLLDAVGSPTKRAAPVDRMQRVDEKRGTRERNT
jgi:hypothetical protein